MNTENQLADKQQVEHWMNYNRENLRGFDQADRQFIAECFQIGEPGKVLEQRVAEVLLEELDYRYDDFESDQGKSREEVLVLACLTKKQGLNWLTPEEREPIFVKLEDKLGGAEVATQVLIDGYKKKEPLWGGKSAWVLENALSRSIHTEVETAVDEFLAEREKPEAAAAAEQVVPVWGEEQRAAAEKFYNEMLKVDERTKVDALARSLLAANYKEDFIIEVMGGLPEAKQNWDWARGNAADFDWIAENMLGEMLKIDDVKDNLKAVMSFKETSKKGKGRGQQIWGNLEFYQQLTYAIHWRIEAIGPEIQKAVALAKEKNEFFKDFSEVDLIEVLKVDRSLDKKLSGLKAEAKSRYDEDLAGNFYLENELKFADDGAKKEFTNVRIIINKGWNGGVFYLNSKTVDGRASEVLVGIVYAKSLAPEGYELIDDKNKGILLRRVDDDTILATIGAAKNQFTVLGESIQNVLEAGQVIGQSLLNLRQPNEKFPYFTIDNLPSTRIETTTELVEPAVLPIEETSGPGLEVMPSPPVDETGKVKVADWFLALSQEPSQPTEPPVKESGGASDKIRLPDWMSETDEEKPGGVLPEGEDEIDLAALFPEAPKPIPVSSLTEISQAIKTGDGVAEVILAPALLTNMVRQTMNSIIQARFRKFNPSISVEIKVNNGLVLEGEINAKWGIVPVRIPVTLTLNNRFGLVSFDFQSKLGDRNEVERELRGVLNQLNNTFRAQLAEYNISGATLENPEIRGEQTFAKIRGKVVN